MSRHDDSLLLKFCARRKIVHICFIKYIVVGWNQNGDVLCYSCLRNAYGLLLF
jgi:hypothetical protein